MEKKKEKAKSIASLESIVGANNRFALELYSTIAGKEGNVFFSPYSISSALAMTYEGACGQTADEMRSVFHFPGEEEMRAGYASVNGRLNKGSKDYKMNVANALWTQKDYPFLSEYLGVIEKSYGGKATDMDFVHEAEKSRETINKWVEDKTNEKIKDLLPQGSINEDVRLVLTNAVYFKGDWATQFKKKLTKEEDFTKSDGSKVKAKMMSHGSELELSYGETDDMQILEMPYKGEELSMLVILPKGNDISKLEKSLTEGNLEKWKGSMSTEEVNVYMPKFKAETEYNLNSTLSGMGMPTAFTGSADFSGMNGSKDLFITDVIHKAYVDVNEEGTEAAAATAVVVRSLDCASFDEPKTFRADHSFVYMIQENESGNILFMGRVDDPAQKE